MKTKILSLACAGVMGATFLSAAAHADDYTVDNPPRDGCVVHFDDLWVNSSGKLALKITYGCRPGADLKAMNIDGWADIKDGEFRNGKWRAWRKGATFNKTVTFKPKTKVKKSFILIWKCSKRNKLWDWSVDSFVTLIPRDPNRGVAINHGEHLAPRSLKCWR